MNMTVKSLNMCYKLLNKQEQTEEVVQALEEIDKQLTSVGYLEQAEELNPELWQTKSLSENLVQDLIAEFYDDVYTLEEVEEHLSVALYNAKQARNKYFDYAEEHEVE